YCTCQVGQNVAEEVVSDNDVIARRVGNHVNGCSVDVVVVDFDVWKFRCDLINGALPQVTSVDQHVGLVHQGQLLTAVLRAVESITHNALNTVTGVLRNLRGHLMLSALAQGAAVAGVQALGAFADNDEVNLTWISQRRYRGWVQLRWAQVNMVVESKAQLQ